MAISTAGAVDVDAFHFVAFLNGESRHAADEREGGLFFRLHGLKDREICLDHAVAFGIEADHIRAVEGGRRDGVEVYTCCQDAAILMISVISADLGAARSGVEADLSLRVLRESDLETFYYLSKSVCVSLRLVGIASVDLDHAPVQSAALQFCEKCASVFHSV